jgi:WD40 repeat protein
MRLKLSVYRTHGATSLTSGHEGSISSVFMNNEGTVCVSGGYDRILVLWDIIHGFPKLSLRVGNILVFIT